MSFMNFLENSFSHINHGLVVRILASGAGGPGSNPGGVNCELRGRTLETMGHA